MSNFGPIRCMDCGKLLDNKQEAFNYIRQTKNTNQVAVDKKLLDFNEQIDISEAFDILHIRNSCCKAHLMSSVTLDDLINNY